MKWNADQCCDDMRHARQSGTDNEMYGALVYWSGDKIVMGCDLPAIRFCPWCGHEKTDE